MGESDMEKALIGMSGGVDSSVAAYLMKQEGFQCIGATMRLYQNEDAGLPQGSTCCSLDDVEDARSVARRLGIPHYTFNFSDAFREYVMEPFVRTYEAGGTPNPCIACNQYLKFGALLQRARELGCRYVVTGHYARIRQDPDTGRWLLLRGLDRAKDQTYFLYPLTQDQLGSIRFPLGELTKEQVRAIALEQGFVNAKKRDSQDICFVPDGDYRGFLERFTGKEYPSGDFLDREGHVVGTHRGAVSYTLGQRKGLGVALGAPAYVCAKDMEKNTVTLGRDQDLYSTGLRADSWFWFPFPALTQPMEVTAKTRHSLRETAATVYPEDGGNARVVFHDSQRAITPGQAVVLYQGDTVIGGGTIIESIP